MAHVRIHVNIHIVIPNSRKSVFVKLNIHNMFNKEVPKQTLQTLLCHCSIKTTKIYANWLIKKNWESRFSPLLLKQGNLSLKLYLLAVLYLAHLLYYLNLNLLALHIHWLKLSLQLVPHLKY